MKFSSIQVTLDQRSGLNLTPDRALKFKERFDLQFQIRFDADLYAHFGYVFRLILGNSNIDLVHGIVPGNPNNFELILNHQTSKIVFNLPPEELISDWLELRFEIDPEKQKITCLYKDQVLVDELVGFDGKKGVRLMFGAHSFERFSSTDVPGMIIRNIEVRCDEGTEYLWPLDETEGTIARSVPRGKEGIALHPVWLLKDHNKWFQTLSRQVTGRVKTAYDPRNEDLYIVSKDSIYILNIPNNQLRIIPQDSTGHIETTSDLTFDTIAGRLLLYSTDFNYLSEFDFDSREWSTHDPGPGYSTTFLHHNRCISPDGALTIFGGYGQYRYRKSALAWNQEMGQFDTISYKGEFNPRYLAGSGFNPKDSLLYFIGGYGSESGKQTERPDYYYEILSYSFRDSAFASVHEYPREKAGFCFANSLVFDNANNMYGLYFEKYHFDNQLQLVQIPLDNPEIIQLGNPIEYTFQDVNSYADLFYSKISNNLIAVSTYFSNGETLISVYSLAFPPEAYTVINPPGITNKSYLAFFLVSVLLLIATAILFYYRRGRESIPKNKPPETGRETEQKPLNNSIILFGGFQVIGRDGNDITGQFTPLPKKLFLFIMLHSLRNGKGVSSNVLYETFWFDKSVESARNNRAVNIVKLKSLLDNLDTASISKETGYWKFDFDPSRIYIDYFNYMNIVHHRTGLSREQIVELLSIVENKPFLVNTQAEWLDPFKSEVSNEIIDTFLRYLANSVDDPEFLLHLSNCIFLFDSVSEEALKFQCKLLVKQGKHSLAKQAYSNFVSEYRQLYDEEYGLSFKQIIEEA